MRKMDTRAALKRARLGLLAFCGLVGACLGGPARAASYPEAGRPVYLGMGGATFAGGSADAATGAAMLHTTFGSLRSRGRATVTAGFMWKGQDNSPGPFGPGTFMSYDWFLQSDGSQFHELVGPGNHRFEFGNYNGNNTWIDTRDPEMLGAILSISPDGQAVITWKDGTQWTFDTGGSNGLLQVTDRHGNPVIRSITRNPNTGIASQLLLSLSDPNRYVAFSTNGPNGQVDSVTLHYDAGGAGSLNRIWTIAYDGNNRLSSITDPLGGISHYTWTTYTRDDSQVLPLLATVVNPRGFTALSNQYDSLGRISRQTYADGGFLTATYPATIGSDGFTFVTDPKGNVTRWGYVWELPVVGHKEGYHIANYQDALGRTTQWDQLSPGSNLDTRITDYRNRITTLGWDFAKGNLTTVTKPDANGGTATTTGINEPTFSQYTSITDALGRRTTYTVNGANGDITAATDPRNNSTNFTRNSFGDATSVTNALNQTTNFTFGSFGELQTRTDALGHVTTWTYDAASRVTSIQDANGKVVNFTYDLLDRLLSQWQVVNGQTLTTSFSYDPDGNRISMTDAKGQLWQWTYDSMDRVSAETNPLSQSITYAYDLNGNLANRTNRQTQQWQLSYDAADRISSKTFLRRHGVLESTVNYNYDASTHLLTSVTDSLFGTMSWTYDSLDRRISRSVSTSGGPNGTLTFTLEPKLNRRNALLVPGQGTISYGFDNNDNITSIAQNGQSTALTYDALNRMTLQSLPNGVSTAQVFDSAGFLSSRISSKSGSAFDNHVYTRDSVGNITQEALNHTTSLFGYDDLYRLTSSTVQGTASSWSYDAVGNRLSQTVGGLTTTYTYNSADRLTSVNGAAVTTDEDGNLTAYGSDSYVWDMRGRLQSLTRPGFTYLYSYDPFDLRATKSVNGTVTSYLLDGDSVVSETTGGTTIATLQSPFTDQPLERNGEWFTSNHLGSTTSLTDGNGTYLQSYGYTPFGELTGSVSDSNPFQFTGRENEGNGLQYNRARYYAPAWGRFISEDPIGLAGGVNPFVYAGNNPVNATDPSGEFTLVGLLAVRTVTTNATLAPVAAFIPSTPPNPYLKTTLDNLEGLAKFVDWLFGVLFPAPSPSDLLMPGGKPIGDPGSSPRTRILPGGVREAEDLFIDLAEDATDLTSTNQGVVAKLPGGGYVGFRPSSKSGPPTIDVNVPGIPIKEIKFK